MLLGFISLLLTVFQGAIQNICIPKSLTEHMLPCKKDKELEKSSSHYQAAFFSGVLGSGRRLLAGGGETNKCAKVPPFVPLSPFPPTVRSRRQILRFGYHSFFILSCVAPGKSAAAVFGSASPAAHLHLRSGHCSCHFLCAHRAFRRGKGKCHRQLKLFRLRC